MRTLLTSLAVIVVVFGSLGALDWSAHQAQRAPAGEVMVVELTDASDVQAYANVTPGYRLAKSL